MSRARKTSGQRRHERKTRLYEEQNGLCFYCHEKMFLKPRPLHPEKPYRGRHRPDEATIEHLNDRYDLAKRRAPNVNHETRRVLVCHKCNSQREIERTSALPKEELWKRSGRIPSEPTPAAGDAEDTALLMPPEKNTNPTL